MIKELNNYVMRPNGKPDSSKKGKMNSWNNGYVEFIPQGTRETQRKLMKEIGDARYYKTEGKKSSSYTIHLNVNGDSVDPVGEMYEQFLALTAGDRKQMPTLPEGQNGRMLYDDGQNMKAWLDHDTHQLTIQTQLDCTPQIERQLLQAQASMNVLIGRHRTEIVNLSKEK